MKSNAKVFFKFIKDIITTLVITALFAAAFIFGQRWVILYGLYELVGPTLYYLIGIGFPLAFGLLTSFGNLHYNRKDANEVSKYLKDKPIIRTKFHHSDYDVKTYVDSYVIKVNGEELDQNEEFKELPEKGNYNIEIIVKLKDGKELREEFVESLNKITGYQIRFDSHETNGSVGYNFLFREI